MSNKHATKNPNTKSKKQLYNHAIVVGGSIGGLLAAHVLADYFTKVTIIERDTQEEANQPKPRKGVPQGGNTHAITTKALRILNEFFPQLYAFLAQYHVYPIAILQKSHFYFGDWMPVIESKLISCYMTRPLLEYCIRVFIQENKNITCLYGQTVQGILTNKARDHIEGIVIADENNLKTELHADLIVDASGRRSLFPGWLENLGYKLKLTEIKMDLFYTTYLFRNIPAMDYLGVIIATGYKRGTRHGALWEVEQDEYGRKWQVSVTGHSMTPVDINEFIEFTKTLLQPDIYQLIVNAEPIIDSCTFFKFTGSKRWHYEKAKSLPSGFIALGNAFCTLNPIYGHGMSACVLEAKMLAELLATNDSLAILQKKYFNKASEILTVPWNMANYHDFTYPGTVGKPPLLYKKINAYQNYIYKASVKHPSVWLAAYKVLQLETRPSSLLSPLILFRVSKIILKETFQKFKYLLKEKMSTSKGADKTAEIILKKIDLFEHLNTEEFAKLCSTADQIHISAGTCIIKENQLGKYFYIIEKGSARVFSEKTPEQEIVLARLDSGDYFGEQALLEEAGHANASVKALTDMQVLRFSRLQIQKILLNEQLEERLQHHGKAQLIYKLTKNLPLLDTISAKLLGIPIIKFADKQNIFFKGDIAEHVYLIISGNVIIYLQEGDKNKFIKLGAGELFGEFAVLKSQLRMGTAVAQGTVKAICIDADLFKKLYKTHPELQVLSKAKLQNYQIPHRGKMTIRSSSILNYNAINTVYDLEDGRTVIANQILEQNIFIMRCENADNTRMAFYKYNDENHQQLGFAHDKLVSIACYGSWDDLGQACGLLLDNISVMPWQIRLYEDTGSLGEQMPHDPNDTVCFCTLTSYKKVMDVASRGGADLNTLARETGAGSVCGGCRPALIELLGKNAWSTVYIDKIIEHTPDIKSYQFKTYKDNLPKFKPGQHIVLQALIDKKWISRSYTLTSPGDQVDYYELTIKRETQGYFSRWLFANDQQHLLLRLSAPQGEFTFNIQEKKPLVFFAAGIGITPALAFARMLQSARSSRRMHIDYSAHAENQFIAINEFAAIADTCANFSIKTRNTTEQGRIKFDDVKQIVEKYADAEFNICGPDSFRDAVIAMLHRLGVQDIHFEKFVHAGGPVKQDMVY